MHKVFPQCQCSKSTSNSGESVTSGASQPSSCENEIPIHVVDLERSLDITEDCIASLLCYLEKGGWIKILNVMKDKCTLKCDGGVKQIKSLAKEVPVVKAAVSMLKSNGKHSKNGMQNMILHC